MKVQIFKLAHNDGLKTTGRHCFTFYQHERNSFMRNSCFSSSVHATVPQTGWHMQPMVFDENSIALTVKHKWEHWLEKRHERHNNAYYRNRQCVMQDLDLIRVKMHRFKSNECEAGKIERAVSIKKDKTKRQLTDDTDVTSTIFMNWKQHSGTPNEAR